MINEQQKTNDVTIMLNSSNFDSVVTNLSNYCSRSINAILLARVICALFAATFLLPNKSFCDTIEFKNLTPKLKFEFNSISPDNDTLKIVTCMNEVYFPFGRIKSEFDLRHSALKSYKIKKRNEYVAKNERETLYYVSKNNDRLVMFFNSDSEGTISSYITAGKIIDPTLEFSSKQKIGMTKRAFFELWFSTYPQSILHYNSIHLISCVDDITHKYIFADDKLKEVDFVSTSYWNINLNENKFK